MMMTRRLNILIFFFYFPGRPTQVFLHHIQINKSWVASVDIHHHAYFSITFKLTKVGLGLLISTLMLTSPDPPTGLLLGIVILILPLIKGISQTHYTLNGKSIYFFIEGKMIFYMLLRISITQGGVFDKVPNLWLNSVLKQENLDLSNTLILFYFIIFFSLNT